MSQPVFPSRAPLPSRRTSAPRRRWGRIGGVAVVAVVGVFAAVYLLFFTPDSPPPLTLIDDPPPAAGGTSPRPNVSLAAGQLNGTWQVAAGSEAGYRVREKLVALPASSDAVGRSTAVTGQLRLADSGGVVTATDARFQVDLRQLRSDETRRDNKIRTDGLESDRFPMATFTATAPITVTTSPVDGQVVNVSAVGDLALHGVTRRVTIPVEAKITGSRIQLVGSLRFAMSDFAIEPPSIGGFVTVEPEATLEFRLFLEKG